MSIAEATNNDRNVWFSSSYSNGAGGECVEAAFTPAGVLLRDSKVPGGPHIAVSGEAWCGFMGLRVSSPGFRGD